MGVSVSKTTRLQHHSLAIKGVDHKDEDTKTKLRHQYSEEKLSYENLQFHDNNIDTAGDFGSQTLVTFVTCRNNTYKGHTNALAKNVSGLSKKTMDVMTGFHHRNICPYIAFCQNGSITVALTENAENGSLHDYLFDEAKPLPNTLINKWVKESARAIRFLHAHQCPHGNLLPNNCLIFDADTLKLSDYGISHKSQSQTANQAIDERIRYLAPELLTDEKGNEKSMEQADIYALGMLTLEIYTRKQPFHDVEKEMVMSQVTEGKHPSLPDNCPEGLRDMMQRCWNADANARPSSQDVIEELCSWSFEREISPVDDTRKSLKANRVACRRTGGQLLVSDWLDNVYTLNGDGVYRSSLLMSDDKHARPLGRVEGLAVTRDYTFVVDATKYVKVFDAHNDKYVDSFSSFTDEENPNMHADLRCLTTNRNGKVLVGDCYRKVITTHTYPTGQVESKVQYNMTHTGRICVNSKNDILCHYRPDESALSKVAVINATTGDEILSFEPKIDEDIQGKKVRPRGIVCDTNDNIYIAMCVSGTNKTGHVHKYSKTGAFLRCIAKGLFLPMDLEITPDGSIIVANKRSLVVHSLL